MNNQLRVDLLAILAQLCERYPNWRLGQLVANVAGWSDREVWDIEDEQLLEAARQHLTQLEPLSARITVGPSDKDTSTR